MSSLSAHAVPSARLPVNCTADALLALNAGPCEAAVHSTASRRRAGPHQFPIVDRNVLHACKILIDKYPREFAGYACPRLANRAAHVGVKLQRYEHFVCVIDRIIERHPPSPIRASYRAIDKALMVLGSPSKDEGDTLSAK